MLVLDGTKKGGEENFGFSFSLCWAYPVMIERDSWSPLYSAVRGEIRGSAEDKLVRKRRARMFSLIKSESQGREDD